MLGLGWHRCGTRDSNSCVAALDDLTSGLVVKVAGCNVWAALLACSSIGSVGDGVFQQLVVDKFVAEVPVCSGVGGCWRRCFPLEVV